VLPIQDVIPSRTVPVATLALIGVSSLCTLYQAALDPPGRLSLALAHGLVPASASAWTLFSSLVFQPGLVAGAVNLLILWIFGDNVEDRLGRWRFLLLYFGGGAMAGLSAVAIDPSARVALPAASGAIAAVAGAHLRLLPRARVMVLVPLWRDIDLVDVPSIVIAGGWIILHFLRYADGLTTATPVFGAVVAPLTGLAIGAISAPLLKQRSDHGELVLRRD
jgi:membrane associated rhomboid family serine protease